MRALLARAAASALILVASIACSGDQEAGPRPSAPTATGAGSSEPWFVDATASAGVEFRHEIGRTRRYWFPEIMGGGVGFGDVDGDGFLDLYLVQSGDLEQGREGSAPNRLYQNRTDGTFEDVTDTARVGDRGYGMGCAFGDVDDDGRLDLFVTNLGPDVLYRNRGQGSFEDVSAAAGLGHPGWGTSSAFFDYDLDGDLDLFVVQYLNWAREREIPCSSSYSTADYCNPNNYNAPAADRLYRNVGDARFEDVSRPSGIARVFGNGLGVATGDFDADGRPDAYVANDLMANQLWIGQPDGTFQDLALVAGCAVDKSGKAEAGMGVLALDVENDGDLDLFMTHLREQSNTFYLNEGALFVDETARLGLSAPSYAFTGFGVGAADFDHDGLQDLVVANGRVTHGRPLFRPDDPFAEPNLLFRGLPERRFEEVLPQGGLAVPLIDNSRGLALGDYDNDGDVDIAMLDNGSTAKLLENVRPSAGHWIQLRVVTSGGRDAIGALVAVGSGADRQWRQVQAAYSYCSSGDPRVHVGLAERAEPVAVEVRWPGGARERFGPLAVGGIHTIRAGEGTAVAR